MHVLLLSLPEDHSLWMRTESAWHAECACVRVCVCVCVCVCVWWSQLWMCPWWQWTWISVRPYSTPGGRGFAETKNHTVCGDTLSALSHTDLHTHAGELGGRDLVCCYLLQAVAPSLSLSLSLSLSRLPTDEYLRVITIKYSSRREENGSSSAKTTIIPHPKLTRRQ